MSKKRQRNVLSIMVLTRFNSRRLFNS